MAQIGNSHQEGEAAKKVTAGESESMSIKLSDLKVVELTIDGKTIKVICID